MKPFIFSCSIILFCISLSTKAQYDINGNHFSDTLPKIGTSVVIAKYPIARKADFEETDNDSTFIYHQVAEGETLYTLLELYQLCAPCFAEWNQFGFDSKDGRIPYKNITFNDLMKFSLYKGEYLKVARRSDYFLGSPQHIFTRYIWADITKKQSIYQLAKQYAVTADEIRNWNYLSTNLYYLEPNTRLIIRKIVYQYDCFCIE